MNTIKLIGNFLSQYAIALLLLIGLAIVNIGSYLGFGAVVGLYTTGITLILISTILMIETSKSEEPPQQK